MIIKPTVPTATTLAVNLTQQRQLSGVKPATSATSSANTSDTISISQDARDLLADRTNYAMRPESLSVATFDTDQGSKKVDINTYFTPGANTNGATTLLNSLPPLLLPSQKNVTTLTEHISKTFPDFLIQNNISAAPSSITYDRQGQIHFPPDYPYASEFQQALADTPTMDGELRTVNALASHLTEMKKTIPFQREYGAATTQSETEAVVAKYSYLFSDNRHYDNITLNFTKNGLLSITADGKSIA